LVVAVLFVIVLEGFFQANECHPTFVLYCVTHVFKVQIYDINFQNVSTKKRDSIKLIIFVLKPTKMLS
jgi:hypothetical protein